MDIRKPQSQATESKASPSPVEVNKSFTAGTINTADPKVMLPPSVQVILQSISKKYNLPCDLSNITIGDGKLASIVKGVRVIADMVEADSKLLPDLIRLTKKIMLGEEKLANFQLNISKLAVKHQQKIDATTAEIFLLMAKASQKASKLELKTNARNALLEKRANAYTQYYQGSIYAQESALIDVEYQVLSDEKKLLSESKTKKVQFNSERRQKMIEYINSSHS